MKFAEPLLEMRQHGVVQRRLRKDTALVKALLERGADPTIADDDGDTRVARRRADRDPPRREAEPAYGGTQEDDPEDAALMGQADDVT